MSRKDFLNKVAIVGTVGMVNESIAKHLADSLDVILVDGSNSSMENIKNEEPIFNMKYINPNPPHELHSFNTEKIRKGACKRHEYVLQTKDLKAAIIEASWICKHCQKILS